MQSPRFDQDRPKRYTLRPQSLAAPDQTLRDPQNPYSVNNRAKSKRANPLLLEIASGVSLRVAHRYSSRGNADRRRPCIRGDRRIQSLSQNATFAAAQAGTPETLAAKRWRGIRASSGSRSRTEPSRDHFGLSHGLEYFLNDRI